MKRRIVGALALLGAGAVLAQSPGLQPLPEPKFNKAQAELGRYFFFDVRMSGDAALSCATCHDPAKGWGDGQPLSKGYPASEYFRNSPTLINATMKNLFMWDGRLDGSDAGTLVRDMMTEAHTMNMDGRLAQERVKQVPEYVAMWQTAVKKGDDPNGMRIFNIIGEFIKSIASKNAPIDRFLKGDANALSAEAKAGYEVFKGKGHCVSCHNGPIGSDGKLHKTGVPENPEVWNDPLRAITMLRHYSTSGMPNYMNARTDLGAYAITKAAADKGKFNTPSIRDLKYTAPYMHNGMLATLDQVIDFYDKGGGGVGTELKPLNLVATEKQALKTFLLEGMSGDPVTVEIPKMPAYQVRAFGKN
ncbi:MAG: cytochrome c peroxidase [Rhodocyclaceae bacterium]|nr:cytochrome c peroxidase [Rhodocyclaceae bacterium]